MAVEKEVLLAFRFKVKVFSNLDKEEFLAIFDRVKEQNLPVGYALFKEGKKNENVYIVIDGQADVFKLGNKINAVQSGDIIGEMSMVGNNISTATVVAASKMTVYKFKKTSFDMLMNRYPKLNRDIVDVTISRNYQQQDS